MIFFFELFFFFDLFEFSFSLGSFSSSGRVGPRGRPSRTVQITRHCRRRTLEKKKENTKTQGQKMDQKKTTELPLKKTKEKASPPPLFLSSFVVFSLDVVVVVVGFFWVPGRQFFRADRPMGF